MKFLKIGCCQKSFTNVLFFQYPEIYKKHLICIEEQKIFLRSVVQCCLLAIRLQSTLLFWIFFIYFAFETQIVSIFYSRGKLRASKKYFNPSFDVLNHHGHLYHRIHYFIYLFIYLFIIFAFISLCTIHIVNYYWNNFLILLLIFLMHLYAYI